MPANTLTYTTVARQVRSLQYLTLGWMLVECSVALAAAWRARSVALLAFGSDSLVEVISATVVLLQFVPGARLSEARAARVCGLLLYALSAVVLVIAGAGLLGRVHSESSRAGMAVTAGALLMMPLLARSKRRAAQRTGNRALHADAVQSATCAYLAAVTLAGLLLRSLLGVRWLDPLAALAAVPILVVEARRARRGQSCGCG